MAQQILSRSPSNFRDNGENNRPSSPPGSLPTTPSSSKDRHVQGRLHLQELNVGALNNAQSLTRHFNPPSILRKANAASGFAKQGDSSTTSIDSLAEDLSTFHIYSPGKEGDDSVEPTNDTGQGHGEVQASTSSISSPYLHTRRSSLRTKHAHFALPDSLSPGDTKEPGLSLTGAAKHESFSELLSEPDIQYTIERHDAKRFDYILSLPRDAGDLTKSEQLRRICSDANIKESARDNRKVYFGCNVLRQRPRSKSSTTDDSLSNDSYTLIATPLDRFGSSTGIIDDNDGTMFDTLLPPTAASSFDSAELPFTNQNMVSPKAFGASLGTVHSDRAQSVPRSPCSSVARIEDTIEELDKLEDEFEAVNRMVRVKRVPSPDKEAQGARTQADVTTKPSAKPGLRATKQPNLTRTASIRRLAPAKEPAKSTASHTSAPKSGTTGATKASSSTRLSGARPLSLLPPKPPAKSTKPPTKPAFELPGEAVARRLKEQREARLLAAASAPPNTPKSAAPPAGPQLRRVRSIKPPTIPDFELPGEAISRRKREEHEAKIRQQEEEERNRREFKAKPIRLSITPSSVPRETVASRARQSRASIIGESAIVGGSLNVPGSGYSANKRYSVIAGDSGSRVTSQAQVSRGRGTALGPYPSATGETSRAASTSTGSVSGMRSTISVEDVQHQKLRGKEILQRDNTLSSDRDRERRGREANTKQARQEAAERSRVLSREWAEKQKLRAKKSFTARTE
ncbi:carboxylesterase family protein [Ophiostoma piceae UAMH 11346]|uniref:Carboxylesterase family protein n=1 Tax=Ophiostoma piceae (strain UAMH 11346) TaxID=1262450 RepID=S3BUU5_OPHP1|nr:carboxylesterase family protein [Ophiostoma piceae UAMH 11346]